MTDLERQVRTLLDRETIRIKLHDYSRIIDAWDVEKLRNCFTDDVRATYNYNEIDGIDALVNYFKAYQFAPACQVQKLLARSHFIGNMDIALDGDTATSTTYLLALNIAEDDSLHTRCNYYHDQWVRGVDGDWKIRHRHHVTNWLARSEIEIDPDNHALRKSAA